MFYYDAHLDRLQIMEKIKKCGRILKNIEKQTDEICLEVVKQSGIALQFVKEQTKEICLEKVKTKWRCITICKRAIK